MIVMNRLLESHELKQFQFFPLRTNLVPCYIQLDTKSLIELLVDENKNSYLSDINNKKADLWAKYFNMKHTIFKMKDYVFDYSISTDGYAVSIRFIHKSYVDEENKKKTNMKTARQKAKELYQDLDDDEKIVIKKTKEKKRKEIEYEIKLKRQKEKEKFKQLSKEEKKKVIEEALDKKYIEFPYIDKLSNEKRKALIGRKLVYVDPGKRVLYYMVDDDGNYFRYTNRMRMTETKRLKYQKLRENYKEKESITKIESNLNKYNSKTCYYEKFKDYVKGKTEINKQLLEKYQENYFRKLNWFSYLNTKRSEDNLLNKIEAVYGKDIVIIMGDWNQTGRINYISTPGIKLRRKLLERFEVYMIDEYKTSCLHNKTEERCDNLSLPDKKGKMREIHAILTYEMKNKRKGCINRDKNAVLNMRKLANHYLKTGERQDKYRRGKEPEPKPEPESEPKPKPEPESELEPKPEPEQQKKIPTDQKVESNGVWLEKSAFTATKMKRKSKSKILVKGKPIKTKPKPKPKIVVKGKKIKNQE